MVLYKWNISSVCLLQLSNYHELSGMECQPWLFITICELFQLYCIHLRSPKITILTQQKKRKIMFILWFANIWTTDLMFPKPMSGLIPVWFFVLVILFWSLHGASWRFYFPAFKTSLDKWVTTEAGKCDDLSMDSFSRGLQICLILSPVKITSDLFWCLLSERVTN